MARHDRHGDHVGPESEMAWPYKAHLLIELSKLADMDNNRRLKAEYDKQVSGLRLPLRSW